MTSSCDNCGATFTRKFNLKRHQASRCKGGMVLDTFSTKSGGDVVENDDQRSKDSQMSSFISDIINSKQENNYDINRPLKSTFMTHAGQNISDTSSSKKEPVKEIFSGRKIAHPESKEKSEDEKIIDRSPVKVRKLNSADDGSSLSSEISKPSLIDELDGMFFRNRDTDKEKALKDESDEMEEDDEAVRDEIDATPDEIDFEEETQSDVQSLDQEDSSGEEDADIVEQVEDQFETNNKDEKERRMDDDQQNISKDELKTRFYRSLNNMKVFELDLDADEALDNIQLLKYADLLRVPKFRGVFMRDELPERSNPVECGIVNLSTHNNLGTHWVCYAKLNNTRIYFDSAGRKTPMEIQYYLKTDEEFKNRVPVIARNGDIVQRPNTKICGHMCLFVLTSLMREHIPFQHVRDQLNYGYSQYYW